MANGCGGGGGGGVAAPGVPENFQVSGAKGQGMLTLTLTWEKPLTGGAVASYEIYRSDSNVGVFDPENHYVSLSADTFTFTENAGMEDNTSYWVVAAKNAGGETPTDPEAYIQGSAGGGEVEGFGNNFSGAMIFADGYGITGQLITGTWTNEPIDLLSDIYVNTGFRPSTTELTTLPEFPYYDENTTFVIGDTTYYKQQTVSTWQGEWVVGTGTQNVDAKWGDNLVSQTNLTTNSVVRVEMVLTKELETNMTSYNMEYLYGSGPTELWGTNGAEVNTTTAFVFATNARLTIEKLDGVGAGQMVVDHQPLWTCDGPGCFGAEVTVSGNFTYGFVWDLDQDNISAEESVGTWRITFTLGESPISAVTTNNTSINETVANGVWVSPTEVYIDINIGAFGG